MILHDVIAANSSVVTKVNSLLWLMVGITMITVVLTWTCVIITSHICCKMWPYLFYDTPPGAIPENIFQSKLKVMLYLYLTQK